MDTTQSVGCGTGSPKKVSVVDSEFENLEKSVACLEESISQLRDRLAVVSRNEPQPPASDKAVCEEVIVPLAEKIASSRRRIQGLNSSIQKALDMLEI